MKKAKKAKVREYKKPKTTQWGPFWGILKHNVPWAWYIFNLIFGTLYVLVAVEIPQLTGQIMAGEIFDPSITISYIILMAIYLALSLLVGYSTNLADAFTERRIQRDLWRKMIHMSMRDLDLRNPSTLISRLTADTTMLTGALSYIMNVLLETLMLAMVMLEVFMMSPSIGLAILLVIPYIAVVTIVPGRLLYKVQAKMQDTLANFTNYVAERLSNIRLVKSAATERAEIQLGYEIAESNYKAEIKLAVIDLCTQPFTYSTEGIIGAIILIAGGIMVNQGTLGMEELITLYLYSSSIFTSLLQYLFCFYSIKKAQGATKTVSEILYGDSEKMQRQVSFTEPDDSIVFENVTFRYQEQNVLKQVNLTIPAGKVTAIVGPSGAGKSTMLSLLERLYTPDEGAVKFGDTNADTIHLDEWRRAFGYIQQSSPLMSGTIRENILYGLDKEVSEEELIRVAKQANAYDFIMALPDGFDTDIGQLGGKLSGGERQRIAIARMIIKDPDYLLLDEATCNLDAENETAVQNALNSMMEGRTAVVIAHKLRTVVNADQIVVMEQGQIKAVGTHAQLYEGNALYRRYCDLQLQKT